MNIKKESSTEELINMYICHLNIILYNIIQKEESYKVEFKFVHVSLCSWIWVLCQTHHRNIYKGLVKVFTGESIKKN